MLPAEPFPVTSYCSWCPIILHAYDSVCFLSKAKGLIECGYKTRSPPVCCYLHILVSAGQPNRHLVETKVDNHWAVFHCVHAVQYGPCQHEHRHLTDGRAIRLGHSNHWHCPILFLLVCLTAATTLTCLLLSTILDCVPSNLVSVLGNVNCRRPGIGACIGVGVVI